MGRKRIGEGKEMNRRGEGKGQELGRKGIGEGKEMNRRREGKG